MTLITKVKCCEVSPLDMQYLLLGSNQPHTPGSSRLRFVQQPQDNTQLERVSGEGSSFIRVSWAILWM